MARDSVVDYRIKFQLCLSVYLSRHELMILLSSNPNLRAIELIMLLRVSPLGRRPLACPSCHCLAALCFLFGEHKGLVLVWKEALETGFSASRGAGEMLAIRL